MLIIENCEEIEKITNAATTCSEEVYNLGITPYTYTSEDYDPNDYDLKTAKSKVTQLVAKNLDNFEILKRFAENCKTSVNFIKNKKEQLQLVIVKLEERLAQVQAEIEVSHDRLELLIEETDKEERLERIKSNKKKNIELPIKIKDQQKRE